MALEPARLGDFQLNEPIGKGSMAQVFDAVELATGNRVAIKMLGKESAASAELRERLAREARILRGVTSRHVGRIENFGYDGDQPFLVLERLHGETLDAKIKREGQLATREIVHWIEQLLLGVRDCHAANVVHRDIKPSNVFLAEDEHGERFVKLIDFGVARLRELSSAGMALTKTNHLIGSMGYMAPEQFEDAKLVGPQADLYAVGVVVFRVIAGRLPFVNRALDVVVRMKLEGDAPLLSSMPNVPRIRALDNFCASALSRDLNERFQTASDMLDEWWNVVTYIDEENPLSVESSELEVVFDADPEALISTNLNSSRRVPLGEPDRRSVPTIPEEAREEQTSPSNDKLKTLLDEERRRRGG